VGQGKMQQTMLHQQGAVAKSPVPAVQGGLHTNVGAPGAAPAGLRPGAVGSGLGFETQLPFEEEPAKRKKQKNSGQASDKPSPLRLILLGGGAVVACGVMALALASKPDEPPPAAKKQAAAAVEQEPAAQAAAAHVPAVQEAVAQRAGGNPEQIPGAAAQAVQPAAQAAQAAQPAALSVPVERVAPEGAASAGAPVAPNPGEQFAAETAAHYLAGRYPEAIAGYRALAAQQPNRPEFAAMARLIERRAKKGAVAP